MHKEKSDKSLQVPETHAVDALIMAVIPPHPATLADGVSRAKQGEN